MSKIRVIGSLLLLTVIVGCGKSSSERLVGKWKFAPSKNAQNSTEEKSGVLAKVAEGFVQTMTVEFKSDHTGSFSIMNFETVPISWKIVEEQKESTTLELTNLKEKSSSRSIITFRDDDHLLFTPPLTPFGPLEFERIK